MRFRRAVRQAPDDRSQRRLARPAARRTFAALACGGDAPLRRDLHGRRIHERMRSTRDGTRRDAMRSSARSAVAAWPPSISRATSSMVAEWRSRFWNPELGAVLGVERFLSEIRVTANLQHPHLLPLFDSGGGSGTPVLRHAVRGWESLRARLDREKQLPVDEAVRIATAIASALGHAHASGRRASRPQAGEHPASGRTTGRGRLRDCIGGLQGRRSASDPERHHPGHAALHRAPNRRRETA